MNINAVFFEQHRVDSEAHGCLYAVCVLVWQQAHGDNADMLMFKRYDVYHGYKLSMMVC